MKPVGNAMTANYGDETDDGVDCDHEDVVVPLQRDGIDCELAEDVVSLTIQCTSCQQLGILTLSSSTIAEVNHMFSIPKIWLETRKWE